MKKQYIQPSMQAVAVGARLMDNTSWSVNGSGIRIIEGNPIDDNKEQSKQWNTFGDANSDFWNE